MYFPFLFFWDLVLECSPGCLKHSIYEKFLVKVLMNQMQTYIQNIIHFDQVSFILQMQRCVNICKSISVINHIKRLKQKSYSHLNTEKAFDKNQIVFMIKVLKKVGLKGAYHPIIKTACEKLTENFILNGETHESVPLKWSSR